MASTTVHMITVRQGRIVVDVDRYTFIFVHDIGQNGRIELAEISGQVNGRRDTRIQSDDQVAKHARHEARERVKVVVRQWIRDHPGEQLARLDHAVIWTDPDDEVVTNEQRAANQAALDQLVSEVADRLKMPGPRTDRRTLS